MLGVGFGQALNKANNERLGRNKSKNDQRRDKIKRNYDRETLRDDKLSKEEFDVFEKELQKNKKKDLLSTIIIATAIISLLGVLFYWWLF